MSKAKQSKRAAARAQGKADRDKNTGAGQADTRTTKPGENAAGLSEEANEAEEITKNSAKAANEIATRRKEPGAADPENDGPNVGRVDLRADTSAETQQIPRPARPLVPVNAVEQALAAPLKPGEVDDGSLPSLKRHAKVRALRLGYFDNIRRRAGDVFWIHSAEDFGEWMEYAGSSEPEKITTGNQELRKQHDEAMRLKNGDDRAVDVEHVIRRGTGSADPLGAER
jgi:hypothetical protein